MDFSPPKNHSSKVLDWKYDCSYFQGIEQLKKEERRWAKKTKWMNMKAVFGHPFSLGWASPFATPDQGKADPYQYVVWRTLSSICHSDTNPIPALPSDPFSWMSKPKRQHNYSDTFLFFFLMSHIKWLNIAEKKKKKSPWFLFLKRSSFLFFGDRSCFPFFSYLKSLLWPLVSSLLSVWHD